MDKYRVHLFGLETNMGKEVGIFDSIDDAERSIYKMAEEYSKETNIEIKQFWIKCFAIIRNFDTNEEVKRIGSI